MSTNFIHTTRDHHDHTVIIRLARQQQQLLVLIGPNIISCFNTVDPSSVDDDNSFC